jgi:hypothetical protein
MSDPNRLSWQSPFAPSDENAARAQLQMRLLRRGGAPFLLLPKSPDLAIKSLALYAPQTTRARLAKAVLAFALRWRLPLAAENIVVPIARDDPFADYLSQVAGISSSFPAFALLAGNPRTPGQRCIILVFDNAGNPAGVVKVGSHEQSHRLIEHEEGFLKSIPAGTAGVPKLRSSFQSERVRAFTIDFIPGNSPAVDDSEGVEKILTSWLDTSQQITVGDTPAWRKLHQTAGQPFPSALANLAHAKVHPAIVHGDFAPWNIKVNGGVWTLLDWERGELAGIPGWDWFHFVIQNAVLVERAATPAVLARIESLLSSAPFQRYAQRAGIVGVERLLALAYLHYCVDVLRPSEGLEQLKSVTRAALEKWGAL